MISIDLSTYIEKSNLAFVSPVSAILDVSDPEAILKGNPSGRNDFLLSQDSEKVISALYGDSLLIDESSKYPGIITQKISSSIGAGEYGFTGGNIQLEVGWNGPAPKRLYLAFDTVTNEYAKRISLLHMQSLQTMWSTTMNDSPFVVIDLSSVTLSNDDSVRLLLNGWNKPNRPARITCLSDLLNITLTSRDVVSCNWSTHSTDSQATLYTGIIEQFAEIKVHDRQHILRQLLKYAPNILQNATITSGDALVTEECQYKIKYIERTDDDSIYSITCNDVTATFGNLYDYTEEYFEQGNDAKSLYHRVANSAGVAVKFGDYAGYDTTAALSNTHTGSYKEFAYDIRTKLEDLCQFALLRVFWNKNALQADAVGLKNTGVDQSHIKIIGPNNYLDGASLILNRDKIIDAISAQVIDGGRDTAQQHTAGITRAKIFGQYDDFDTVDKVAWPPNVAHRCMENKLYRNAILGTVAYARAHVGVLVGEDTITVEFPEEVFDEPSVEVAYEGTRLQWSSVSVDDLPPADQLTSRGTQLTSWLMREFEYTSTSGVDSYGSGRINTNLWAQNKVPAPTIPKHADIKTAWTNFPNIQVTDGAVYDYWVDYSMYHNVVDNTTYKMRPAGEYDELDKIYADKAAIPLRDSYVECYLKIDRISKTKFQIDYRLPIRYEYVAASQYISSNKKVPCASLIYSDLITKINIILSAYAYNDDVVNETYVLNSNGDDVAVGNTREHTFEISKNMFLTKTSSIDDSPIVSYYALKLLQQYKNGGYTFTCDVKASWFYSQGLDIGQMVHIKNKAGDVIEDGNDKIVFILRNVTRKYTAGSFVMSLYFEQVKF